VKKKEVAARLDEITDALDRVSIATNAPITIGELEGIRLGLIAGMLEAMDMLGGEEPEESPTRQAADIIRHCLKVYIMQMGKDDDDE
jgi:hypothetical protein